MVQRGQEALTVMKVIRIGLCMTALLQCGQLLGAETYRIGPDSDRHRVSDIVGGLKAGDVVEITGDLAESIEVSGSGTRDRPITLRGVPRAEGTRVVRSSVDVPTGAEHGIMVRGDWVVIEGLSIGGALGSTFESGSAITAAGDHLTVRDCYLHHSRQGIHCPYGGKASITIEFCEFDSLGGVTDYGANMHGVHVLSSYSEAVVTVRFCYFHDAVGGGAFFKSRAPRNVLAYNWFESPYWEAVRIVDSNGAQSDEMYPMHSDIVGNVFHQGLSARGSWRLMCLGGEGAPACGTEGTFSIAHNLFVLTRGGTEPGAIGSLEGNIDRVRFYNNATLYYGVPGGIVLERNQWDWQSPRTEAFLKRRGGTDILFEGGGNWVSDTAALVQSEFSGTIRGVNPRFQGLLEGDFRPRADSPLAGGGAWPLPNGQIISLVPEYEPQRSIPADLKARARRKVERPAIGPFEVAE